MIGFDWPRVIGFDFSGVVVEVARDCDDEFKIGDRVFGMIAGLPEKDRGCAAEYLIVDAEVCVKKPDSISHAEAASVPLVGITAVMMLEACGLKLGSKSNARVLVLGGAGGVGSVAIQIAKKMFGASFVATTASKGKKETLVKSLGADLVIDYRSEKFETKLASQDDSKLFDAILACTNEASRCPTLLRKGGAMCSIIGSDDVRTFLLSSVSLSQNKVKKQKQSHLQVLFKSGFTTLWYTNITDLEQRLVFKHSLVRMLEETSLIVSRVHVVLKTRVCLEVQTIEPS